MQISGFTIVKNAVKFDYPVIEAIKSTLPIVDEFIVNVGKSEDDTLNLIKSIKSDKIRIIETVWDDTKRTGGHVLADETNKALRECKGDWCLYIQSDEVIHEKDHVKTVKAAQKYLNNPAVEGLEFNFIHFYGSYKVFQDNRREWYRHEIRIVRNRPDIFSYGDAMGFRVKKSEGEWRKLCLKHTGADIFHYGWVKDPSVMRTKKIETDKLWFNDDIIKKEEEIITVDNVYLDKGDLAFYKGTHPSVMNERVSAENWKFTDKIESQPPDIVRHVLIFLNPLVKRIKRLFGQKEKQRKHFR